MAGRLMLVISVALLHGSIRAGSPDDTVLAGGDPAGEWPPSPARLFSALVAGDGTRDRCTVTTGDELAWAETLDPPLIHASATAEVLVSALQPRFVVVDATASGSVQEYPAREARGVRPGLRQAPFDDAIVYVWPEADPSPEHLGALSARAARVGYLGCADSPVQVTVSDRVSGPLQEPWLPSRSSAFTLPVPYPGFVRALDEAYDMWSAGAAMRRAWIRTVRAGYRAPGDRSSEPVPRPQVTWLRFDRAVAGRKLLAVTQTLRDAVLDHVQRLLPAGEQVAAVLHGHRSPSEEGPQARFLALPDVGHARADGRLLAGAVWLPVGTEPTVVQAVRTAAARLSGERLVKPRWFDLGLSVHTGERRPWTAHPLRWTRPCRRWVTATPVVHERWTKGLPSREEVVRWCGHADLPEPISATFHRHPTLSGALDLHPSHVRRPGHEPHPYSHMEIEFAAPVEGPVVLGRGRQLGLGLMAPVEDPRGEMGG